jgi:cytochrome c peroxidase
MSFTNLAEKGPMQKLGRLTVALVFLAAVPGADDLAPPSLPKDTLSQTLSLKEIPQGLDANRPVPKDNPLTETKVQLGRRLFFDPILSPDGTVSCASCHDPAHGLAGQARLAVGIKSQQMSRNAPSLWNRAYGTAFFWDGRESSLEDQALRPVESSNEMGGTIEGAVKRLRARKEYAGLFEAAFAEGATAKNLAKSLASFERVLLSGNSRVDRFRTGEVRALSDSERHGLWLYESRGGCWRCHSGPNFTDENFHNTGVSWDQPPIDLGRFVVTHKDSDRGRFKTPTLRNVALTAPYMHDGSLATLEDVIDFYNRGGGRNPYLDEAIVPLGLISQDKKDLVAFLKALSGE